ncbi:MAG: family 43 glycosylhydrolase [Bacteroidota bacterium]
MSSQKNPVISGDWSDPAFLLHDGVYYSLRSTFGWQPGLQLMKSDDLVHWEYIGFGYQGVDLGIPVGELGLGIWGSELGFNPNTGTFLIYAPVILRNDKEASGIYVFSSAAPEGPYTNHGKLTEHIDPGFFVDSDSSLYLTNNSGNIYLLSDDGLSVEKKIGKRPYIRDYASGEGPELFRRGDYYYYLASSGGTGPFQQHKVLSFRSSSLNGDWEADPNNPVKYAPHTTKARIQGPGHGEVFQTKDEEWILSTHGYELNYATLGRQASFERVEWSETGWWRPLAGKTTPEFFSVPPSSTTKLRSVSNTFEYPHLGPAWFFHTVPDYSGAAFHVDQRSNTLTVKAPSSLLSTREKYQRYFFQRVSEKAFEISTQVTFTPESAGDMAGLILYADTSNFVKLGLTLMDEKPAISIVRSYRIYDYIAKRFIAEPVQSAVLGSVDVQAEDARTVELKIKVEDPETALFFYRVDANDDWEELALTLPLFFGRKGYPDLGWNRGHWTATVMGLFMDHGSTEVANQAEFMYFSID